MLVKMDGLTMKLSVSPLGGRIKMEKKKSLRLVLAVRC